jgi:hypothetical protein
MVELMILLESKQKPSAERRMNARERNRSLIKGKRKLQRGLEKGDNGTDRV